MSRLFYFRKVARVKEVITVILWYRFFLKIGVDAYSLGFSFSFTGKSVNIWKICKYMEISVLMEEKINILQLTIMKLVG